MHSRYVACSCLSVHHLHWWSLSITHREYLDLRPCTYAMTGLIPASTAASQTMCQGTTAKRVLMCPAQMELPLTLCTLGAARAMGKSTLAVRLPKALENTVRHRGDRTQRQHHRQSTHRTMFPTRTQTLCSSSFRGQPHVGYIKEAAVTAAAPQPCARVRMQAVVHSVLSPL